MFSSFNQVLVAASGKATRRIVYDTVPHDAPTESVVHRHTWTTLVCSKTWSLIGLGLLHLQINHAATGYSICDNLNNLLHSVGFNIPNSRYINSILFTRAHLVNTTTLLRKLSCRIRLPCVDKAYTRAQADYTTAAESSRAASNQRTWTVYTYWPVSPLHTSGGLLPVAWNAHAKRQMPDTNYSTTNQLLAD